MLVLSGDSDSALDAVLQGVPFGLMQLPDGSIRGWTRLGVCRSYSKLMGLADGVVVTVIELPLLVCTVEGDYAAESHREGSVLNGVGIKTVGKAVAEIKSAPNPADREVTAYKVCVCDGGVGGECGRGWGR